MVEQPPEWLTKLLPEAAASFLNSYWYVILGGVGVLVLLLLWFLIRKLFARKKQPHYSEVDRTEELAKYPELKPSTGDRRLLAEGVPVRMRLVVVAPAGGGSRVDADNIEPLLEKILPGLGNIAEHDRPRVRVWPLQLSYEGFAQTFHHDTIIPEGENQPSRWVLMAGRVMVGKNQFLLGLGLQSIKPNTIGRRTLKSDDWASVLRVRVRD